MTLRSRILSAIAAGLSALPAGAQEVPARVLELPPAKGNPRNSEGAFVALKDGRLLFVYTHFTGGGGDHDAAHLAGRYSSDGGRTWTPEDRLIVRNEGGMNVMSVSLLRLQDGEIALFYLLKNSERDCRPLMRRSTDEGATWGEPTACITDEVGYYVLNNDRVIQLKGGRLVAPVCLHTVPGSPGMDMQGTVMCYLSDDHGRTWQHVRVLEGNPQGWYCYIAIHPVDDAVLLGYCAMSGLAHSRVTRVPVSWLYADAPAPAAPREPPLFAEAAPGAFERLETARGIWTAAAGHAEVLACARGKGVRLLGGEDRSVTLTLPRPAPCRSLALGVERFTAKAPYALAVEAEAGGAWRKVWEQDASAPVGRPHPVRWADPELAVSRLRFRCTSALGAIVVEAPDAPLGGFFSD